MLCFLWYPAAVVIVAGRYRSGKSFLMNQLLGDRAGFSVGHTIASHTKGIWLCSEAVPATTPSGEKVSMLFMDSEGLGATDKVCTLRATPLYYWEVWTTLLCSRFQPRAWAHLRGVKFDGFRARLS